MATAARRRGQAPDKTDPRWTRTRDAILQAGKEAFSQHPLDGVSTDDLIRAAGVSKQSFYNHFRDKDALAHEVLRIVRAQLDERVAAINADNHDPALRIATALCVYAREAMNDPIQGGLVMRLVMVDFFSTASRADWPVASDIHAGLAQGRLATFTVETGAALVLGVGQAMMGLILSSGTPALFATTTQHFVVLMLRAFGLDPIEAERIAGRAVMTVLADSETHPD